MAEAPMFNASSRKIAFEDFGKHEQNQIRSITDLELPVDMFEVRAHGALRNRAAHRNVSQIEVVEHTTHDLGFAA